MDSIPGCFSVFQRGRGDRRTRAAPSHSAAADAQGVAQPTLPDDDLRRYNPCTRTGLPTPRGTKDEDLAPPPYTGESKLPKEVRETIRQCIEDYTQRLTEISLWIWKHPELGYQEEGAHRRLTDFLEAEGFEVERGYKNLPTAFKASFRHGQGGRTFSFNSEYDALPGVGHACGHNLIAVAGVAATLGLRAAMKKHDIAGTVVLLGTPAEEGGMGKDLLLKRGGCECWVWAERLTTEKGIDACMMIHPVGDYKGVEPGTACVIPTLAVREMDIEFFGRPAHAGVAPWEGLNALDAVYIAYGSISALRQQLHPTDKVHGIITNGGKAPNIVPDYTSMRYFIRAQTAKDVDDLVAKVKACFDGAALATGCKVKYNLLPMTYDLRNNRPFCDEFAASVSALWNRPTWIALDNWENAGGSTDFGNVTYALPACHPQFGIPAEAGRGNHTPQFTAKCGTPEAHQYTFEFATGMSCVGARFLMDKEFAHQAVKSWKDDVERAGGTVHLHS